MDDTITQRLEVDIETIERRYLSGEGTSKIALDYGCNPGMIWLVLKKAGVQTRKRRGDYGSAPGFDDQIKVGHRDGRSAYSIGNGLGISKRTVLRRARSLGISFSDGSKLKAKVRLKDRADEVLALFDGGLASREIAERVGYAESSIWRLLDEHGRDQARSYYPVDLRYFDAIDTEAKAYLLGFWYADGNVAEDKIRLQVADREVVELARAELAYGGPILDVPPRVEGRKMQYLLAISRKELVEAMKALGCPSAKSLILTFPGPEIVPPNLIHHFCRGYSDGDGSIHLDKKRKRYVIQIVGTRELLEGIVDACGIGDGYWSKRHPKRPTNNWTLAFTSLGRERKFCDWLYRDATIYLDRKYARYQDMKSGRP